ncbi:MAG TPA: protease HtpX [Rhodanobacteraceae bacterium]|jgi:heat shock protein HtpX|nr:protease HtpX [Rhodanobacteraceae bacterium]
MRRILLFVLTNIAVLALLTIICRIFGIDAWLAASGYGGLGPLLGFAAVFGFGGAFISLAMSKSIAKWTTGAHVIDRPETEQERWLVATVRHLAQKAGIGMPEVAIYDAPEMNAFATGMSRNRALVAVSTGLLQSMNRDQASAVLGHEVTHVANGDMVTMTLLQGVLNTFVIFLARVVGRIVDSAISGGNNRGGGVGYFAIVIVLQIVFGLLASLIVMAFSRWREFRADGGGARLAGRDRMISALQRLGMQQGANTLPRAVHAFGISGGLARGIQRLWMSHPPIEERIARLRGIAVA